MSIHQLKSWKSYEILFTLTYEEHDECILGGERDHNLVYLFPGHRKVYLCKLDTQHYTDSFWREEVIVYCATERRLIRQVSKQQVHNSFCYVPLSAMRFSALNRIITHHCQLDRVTCQTHLQ